MLREVYLLDNWDAPVEDVDRARQILERLSAEADARIEALMRWDAERQQQAYEERQRQVKSEDS